MEIKKTIDGLDEFKFWGGAIERYNEIVELGIDNEIFSIIEAQYPDGLSETELNDCIWFDFDDMIEEMKENLDEEEL